MQYTPHAAISRLALGNGLIEKTTFNSRLQPIQIALGTTADQMSLLGLDYTYGASASVNNGNITQ